MEIASLRIFDPCQRGQVIHECRKQPIALPPGAIHVIDRTRGPPQQARQRNHGSAGENRHAHCGAVEALAFAVQADPAHGGQDNEHHRQ